MKFKKKGKVSWEMFECLLLCLALCVLGIGCTEMSRIDMILVFLELRVDLIYLLLYFLFSNTFMCAVTCKREVQDEFLTTYLTIELTWV